MKKKTAKAIKPQVSAHLLSNVSFIQGASQNSTPQNSNKLKSGKSTDEFKVQKRQRIFTDSVNNRQRGSATINAPAVHVNEKETKSKEMPHEQPVLKKEEKPTSKKQTDKLSPRSSKTKNKQTNISKNKETNVSKNKENNVSKNKETNVKNIKQTYERTPASPKQTNQIKFQAPPTDKSSPKTSARRTSVQTKTSSRLAYDKPGSPKNKKTPTNKKKLLDKNPNNNEELNTKANERLQLPLKNEQDNKSKAEPAIIDHSQIKADDIEEDLPQQELVNKENNVDESKEKKIDELIAQMDAGFRSIAEILKSGAFEGINIPENLLILD